jgi:hypothetical protein
MASEVAARECVHAVRDEYEQSRRSRGWPSTHCEKLGFSDSSSIHLRGIVSCLKIALIVSSLQIHVRMVPGLKILVCGVPNLKIVVPSVQVTPIELWLHIVASNQRG